MKYGRFSCFASPAETLPHGVIGIPKALHYYYHFSEWERFLKGKNYDLVVSPDTNREILEKGLRLAPPEICLPLKVYLGHCAELKEKVDAIFVPRMVRCRMKNWFYYGCPKAIALPDLVRATFPKVRIYELEIDDVKNPRHRLNLTVVPAGQEEVAQSSLPMLLKGEKDHKIMIIAHPYLLYDRVLAFDLIKKVKERGIMFATPFDGGQGEKYRHAPIFDICWFYEQHLLSAALVAKEMGYSGIILFYSFGCGTAAVINEIINREIARPSGIPVLNLVIDEHTQETGIETRVESFLEILTKRAKIANEDV